MPPEGQKPKEAQSQPKAAPKKTIAKTQDTVNTSLFGPVKRNYGIGGAIQPRRDLAVGKRRLASYRAAGSARWGLRAMTFGPTRAPRLECRLAEVDVGARAGRLARLHLKQERLAEACHRNQLAASRGRPIEENGELLCRTLKLRGRSLRAESPPASDCEAHYTSDRQSHLPSLGQSSEAELFMLNSSALIEIHPSCAEICRNSDSVMRVILRL